MHFRRVAVIVFSLLFLNGPSAAGPPEFDVSVTNDEANPVPVTVQNAGQDEAIEVFTAPPSFYRLFETVFGSAITDRVKRETVNERVVLYDVSAETTSIHQVAGCNVSVYEQTGGPMGPITWLFETNHFEKDVSVHRDGQITQQRLGRGVVIEPGEEIVFAISNISDPDIPIAGPDAFCSAYVQLFGEVLSD